MNPPPHSPDAPLPSFIVPHNPSAWAVAAGYLGLFALIPVFAPFALAVGILALRDLRNNPQKSGRGRAIFGIVMGALFSVLLVAILFSRSG